MNEDDENVGIYSLKKRTKDIIRSIYSDHYRVIVDGESAKKFFNDDGNVCLTFYVIVKPSILQCFDKVIFASQNFKNSLVYKIWSQEVAFIPLIDLKNRLDYNDFSHKKGLVTIDYLSMKTFSKASIRKVGYQKIVDALCEISKNGLEIKSIFLA